MIARLVWLAQTLNLHKSRLTVLHWKDSIMMHQNKRNVKSVQLVQSALLINRYLFSAMMGNTLPWDLQYVQIAHQDINALQKL
jgi:hypothetical protein